VRPEVSPESKAILLADGLRRVNCSASRPAIAGAVALVPAVGWREPGIQALGEKLRRNRRAQLADANKGNTSPRASTTGPQTSGQASLQSKLWSKIAAELESATNPDSVKTLRRVITLDADGFSCKVSNAFVDYTQPDQASSRPANYCQVRSPKDAGLTSKIRFRSSACETRRALMAVFRQIETLACPTRLPSTPSM